tara:strand:+ start:581 stop:763 length:183 start_codon:yes stop_codon:yes gene_type:complete
MSKKIAIFGGITGQNGSYLSDFLINKKYITHSLVWKVKYDLTYGLNKTINFYKKNHVSII